MLPAHDLDRVDEVLDELHGASLSLAELILHADGSGLEGLEDLRLLRLHLRGRVRVVLHGLVLRVVPVHQRLELDLSLLRAQLAQQPAHYVAHQQVVRLVVEQGFLVLGQPRVFERRHSRMHA